MYKACSTCGHIHKVGEACPKKAKKKYKKLSELDQKTKDYKSFLSSSAWQKKREEIKKRDLYLCPICHEQGRYDGKRKYDKQKVEVHHILSVRKNWDLRLEKLNLITLCEFHHKKAEDGTIKKELLLKLAQTAENTPPV